MKTSWWLISLIMVSGLTGCSREIASNSAEEPVLVPSSIAKNSQPDPETLNTEQPTKQSVGAAQKPLEQSSNPQSAQTPATSASANSSLPVPNLIPPTASAVRVPQSEVGRSDPFATILVTPTVSFKPSTVPAASPSMPSTAPTVTAVPVPPLPSLPAGQTVPITQFPPTSVPSLPPPRRLSETIEISGVVEVGGKTSVIVKAPDEHSSRYVQVGDYLSNGKVLVKRVEMGMEPVVILEEDGAEVTRYVGGGSSLSGLL